jgi:hypothetical protein
MQRLTGRLPYTPLLRWASQITVAIFRVQRSYCCWYGKTCWLRKAYFY